MVVMRLKQRVFLVAALGISFLFLLKFKLRRDELYFESAKRSIIQLSEGYDDLVDPHAYSSNDDHGHMHLVHRKDNPIEEFLTKKPKLLIDIPDPVGVISPEQSHPWLLWRNMVNSDSLTPANQWKNVQRILDELTNAPIKKAGLGVKGTQLKLSLHLDGPMIQQVVYKPMRYNRSHVIVGSPYDGFDRHNGEIAAFHLDHLLGFNRAPPVAGRMVDLDKEIVPRASAPLVKTFSKNGRNDTCFYGVCLFCTSKSKACATDSKLEGSMTIWLPVGWSLAKTRHPWQRTYVKGRKARWEVTSTYCEEVKQNKLYRSGRRLLDLMDTAIFDFLIGNADRHHYETFAKDGSNGMILHLDNAKSFGNPYKDEMSILAPILQCCRLRKSTYKRLLSFGKKQSNSLSFLLNHSMSYDRTSPVLAEPHLAAIDRRMKIALNSIANCVAEYGHDAVLKE